MQIGAVVLRIALLAALEVLVCPFVNVVFVADTPLLPLKLGSPKFTISRVNLSKLKKNKRFTDFAVSDS